MHALATLSVVGITKPAAPIGASPRRKARLGQQRRLMTRAR
jgi:hypothetical protein